VDPVPDPLLLRKSGSAANRTRTSGSVARNADHSTTKICLRNFNPILNGRDQLKIAGGRWKNSIKVDPIKIGLNPSGQKKPRGNWIRE
jgi:hypothetical protein